MEGLIDERKTPERGGKTLAVREKVEKKSDVSVVVVEFLQLTVVVCRAFSPEVPHDSPQFSHRGNQQPGCVVEIEEEIEGEQDDHYDGAVLKQTTVQERTGGGVVGGWYLVQLCWDPGTVVVVIIELTPVHTGVQVSEGEGQQADGEEAEDEGEEGPDEVGDEVSTTAHTHSVLKSLSLYVRTLI